MMKRCLGCMEEYDRRYRRCPFCDFDETEESDREYLRPGSMLQQRYVVGKALRKRETDIIYIGWDQLFQRKVTIQEFFPEYCATRSGEKEVSVYSAQTRTDLFRRGLKRFVEQGRELLRLYAEEDIAEPYSCFLENRTGYLISEYRELPTLEEYLAAERPRKKTVQGMMIQMMEAVEALHEYSIIHSSLEESSFWVREDGRIILKEPELARCICGRLDTLDYGNPGPWTDVYGLAAIFERMLSGTEPKGAFLRRHLRGNQKRILENGLQSHPHYRPQTVNELWAGLMGNAKVRKKGKGGQDDGALPGWLPVAAGAAAVGITAGAVLLWTGILPVGPKFRLEKRAEVLLPNLLNESVEDAQRICEENGLVLKVGEEKRYDSQIPADRILEQVPSVYDVSVVEEGTEIRVVLSGGPGPEKGSDGAPAPEETKTEPEETGAESAVTEAAETGDSGELETGKETRPAAEKETKAAAVKETKPAAVKETKAAAVKETKAAAVKETKPAAVKETKPAAAEETRPAAVKETKPAAVKETKPAAGKETKPAAVKETKPAAAKETNPTDIKETKPADGKETGPIAPNETNSAVLGETTAAAPKEPEPSALESETALIQPESGGETVSGQTEAARSEGPDREIQETVAPLPAPNGGGNTGPGIEPGMETAGSSGGIVDNSSAGGSNGPGIR